MTTTSTSPETTFADAPEPGRPRRGADVLVEALVAHGVTTLFGVPGDTGVIFYDALYGATDRIEHVLARDERHAAAMADGYARVTNRVGVVEVSSGGGTTYVVGGLGEAYASGVPVLLITSDIHTASRGTGALTEIDQVTLFSAVTKWRTVVEAADDIPAVVATALQQATTGRPAPVAVIVPENVLEELTTAPVVLSDAQVPAQRLAAAPDAVARAAAALSEARQPVIVAGGGVHVSSAYDSLRELADRLAAPIATTIHGHGTIATSNPWSIGVVGNNAGQPGANDTVAEADAVLFVGTRANATDTNSWTAPARTGAVIVQIDIDAGRAGRNFPSAIGLAGDADTVLRQLAAELPPADKSARSERLAVAAAARSRATPRTDSDEFRPGVLYPRAVVEAVHELLGEQVVVVADPGTPVVGELQEQDRQRVPGHGLQLAAGHREAAVGGHAHHRYARFRLGDADRGWDRVAHRPVPPKDNGVPAGVVLGPERRNVRGR